MKQTIVRISSVTLLAIGCVLGSTSSMANAHAYQSLESIKQAVSDLVLSVAVGNSRIESINIDNRLRLKRCDMALETFWPQGARQAGNTSVGVACNDAKPWKIYVPVRIAMSRRVLVAVRPLNRGETLQESDLMMVERDVSRLNNRFMVDAAQYIGHEVRYTINENRVLEPNMFKPPQLIKRGDQVLIVAGQKGFEVRMSGQAMGNGTKGSRISVRNNKSKRVVQGEVVDKGMVRVN